jgi:2-dehydro-3-deoxygluconokinase
VAHPELVTMGETMALLTHGQTTPLRHARSLDVGAGGSESNVAIAAARLGISTAWIGRVGDDEFARMVTRELMAEGVRTYASVDPSKPTALMIKGPRNSRSTHVTYYRADSAGSALGQDDIHVQLLRSAKVFHTSAITPALSATAREAVHHCIDICREAGTLVSIDLNFRRALWSEVEAGAEFRYLASKADIVFATQSEAKIPCEASDPAALAKELAALGGGSAVVKRGEFGAIASIQGHEHFIEAVPVVTVDPVGAGDAFAAGYHAATLRGHDTTEALRWAALMGAWSVSTYGDWQGLPRLEELETLLDSRDGVLR